LEESMQCGGSQTSGDCFLVDLGVPDGKTRSRSAEMRGEERAEEDDLSLSRALHAAQLGSVWSISAGDAVFEQCAAVLTMGRRDHRGVLLR
jgi:hypothetical protein